MLFFHSRRPYAVVFIAAVLSLPGWAAEPLSLAEAQALAVARSQLLAANNASITASREMAAAAGQLPDPILKFGVENLPLTGPGRLSLSRDFMTMRRIGLSQELPRAQKRQLRAERVEREADRTRAEKQLNVANIMRDTAIAWIERYYTDEMRHLVLRQIRETELQVQTAQSGYGTGRNSQADFFAARAALVMLEDRLSEIDRQARNAELTLARWIGPDANRTVATTPPPWQTSWLDGVALEAHLQHHPDLILLRARLEAALTEARLAEANKNADWSVEATYSQRGSAYSDMVSFGVSVPLQWDQKSRQDREVAAKLALVDEARARYEEMLRQYDAELRNLLNDWRTGKRRVARYLDELVPLATHRSDAALTAYRTGKGDLAATLLARRDEVDTRMQALAVEMDTARAWARQNFLIPEYVPGTLTQEQP